MGTKTPLVIHKTELSQYQKAHTVGYRQYSRGRVKGKAGKVRVLPKEQVRLIEDQLRQEGRI